MPANVVLGKVEVALEDVWHWFSKAQQIVLKGPAILMALTVLIQGVEKVIADVAADAANPLALVNVQITNQQLIDVQAVIPEIKAVLVAAGVKFTS